MSTEIELVQHLDKMNNVVSEYLKGNDPTKISKQLGMKRTEVVEFINEWKLMASANDAIRARAKDALAGADAHFSLLINRAYEVIEDASTTANLSAKTAGIKLVLDIEAKRIDMLQKAGLLENKELAEEMIAIEKKQEVLMNLLKDIAAEYPEVRNVIMSRLSSIAKQGEAVTIVHQI